jgi:hypothetical protein
MSIRRAADYAVKLIRGGMPGGKAINKASARYRRFSPSQISHELQSRKSKTRSRPVPDPLLDQPATQSEPVSKPEVLQLEFPFMKEETVVQLQFPFMDETRTVISKIFGMDPPAYVPETMTSSGLGSMDGPPLGSAKKRRKKKWPR